MSEYPIERGVLQQNKQKGFSLVELMVASAVGLVLLSGMVTVFQGNRQTADLAESMTNIQENARVVMDMIAKDARASGFQGCVSIQRNSANIAASDAPTTNYINTAATAFQVTTTSSWTPAAPPTFSIPTGAGTPVPGTHALLLQYGSSETAELTSPMSSPADVVRVDANSLGIEAGDLVIVSNCNDADLFRVTKRLGGSGSNQRLTHKAADNQGSGALSATYGNELLSKAVAMEFISNLYFIGDTGLTNESGDPITALYRQSLPYSEPPVMIVDGVENLRVRFATLQGSSIRYYEPGDAALNPANIRSIHLGLLFNSRERVASDDDDRTYMLAGQPIDPESSSSPTGGPSGLTHRGDKRYRLAFNTSIKLRNRPDQL